MRSKPTTSIPAISAAMKTQERTVYQPIGMLALQPQAFGMGYPESDRDPGFKTMGEVAVVEVVGPMMHHEDWWFESYDAIKQRITNAIESPAKCVLLSIDSPGGLVAGCFDTVREVRKIAAAKGKRLYSYVDALSASGGYAMACIGERIYCPPTGIIGSIGVISMRADCTGNDAQYGVKVHFITSGKRKADGNPSNPMTAEEQEAEQKIVDDQAMEFWKLVAECRPGLSVDDIKALEAGVFVGEAGRSAGLVDEIKTFDEVISILNSSQEMTATTPEEGISTGGTAVTYDEIKEALKAIAEGEDEEAAKKAKAALAAMDEPDGDEPEPEKAEEEEPHEEPDGDEEDKEKASANILNQVIAMSKELKSLREEQKREKESKERSALMASRPDFDAATVALLNKQPIAMVREAVKALPRMSGKNQVAAARAAMSTGATVPEGAQDPSDSILGGRSNRSGFGDSLDSIMGLSGSAQPTERVGTHLVLNALTPEKSRELRAKNGGK